MAADAIASVPSFHVELDQDAARQGHRGDVCAFDKAA